MLDVVTLRVAFGVVAVCVLVLFYGVSYRSTRSAFAGWWCLSLAMFGLSALLFVFNGTSVQLVANPLGNGVAVLGGACVWAAARSLDGVGSGWRQLAVVPVIVLLASLMDTSQENIWPAGELFLGGMSLMFGCSAVAIRSLRRSSARASSEQVRFAVNAILVASVVVSVFYLGRTLSFIAVGPDHALFARGFGTEATTLLLMILLVVVTFGMSALSHEQQISELRRMATRDPLTGLLNRVEFVREARRFLERGSRDVETAVLLADLDRFKSLNDNHGHAAGDRALTAFARVCEEIVAGRGIVGRLGGDEFVLLIRGASAERVAREIGSAYSAELAAITAITATTVSVGIAAIRPGDDVALAVAHADDALYRAKAAGRAQVARYDDRPRLPESDCRTS